MATDSDGVHVFSPPELVSCQFEPCSGLWAFPCLLQVLGRSHCTLGKGKELHNRGRYAAPDAPCRSFLPQHEAMIRPGAASAATRASVLQRHIAARSILVSYRSTLVASRACHALFRTFGGTGIFVRNLSHETVLRRRLDFIALERSLATTSKFASPGMLAKLAMQALKHYGSLVSLGGWCSSKHLPETFCSCNAQTQMLHR